MQDVFVAHRPALVRFLRARGGGDEAEDLVQDLWLKIGSCAAGSVDDPLAYLFRMADNLMIDRHRAAIRRRRREERWSAAVSDADRADDPCPEREVAARQELAAAAARLRDLGPRTEGVFLRFKLDGVAQRRIAEEQGISLSAVEKHLQKAYRALMRVDREPGAETVGARRPDRGRTRDGRR